MKKLLILLALVLFASFSYGLTISSGVDFQPSNSEGIFLFNFDHILTNVTTNSTHLTLDDFSIKFSNNIFQFDNITTQSIAGNTLHIYEATINETGTYNISTSSPYTNEIFHNKLVWEDSIDVAGAKTPPPATMPIYIYETIPTSYKAFSFQPTDTTFSSSTYVDISSFSFNTSSATTTLAVLGGFNLYKASGVNNADVYLNFLVDGVSVSEQRVGSAVYRQYKVTGIDTFDFNVSAGSHNLTIQAKRIGAGAVEISNFDLVVGKFATSDGGAGSGDTLNIDANFTSTLFTPIANFTLTKTTPSFSYIKVNLDVNSTGENVITCKITDGTESPLFIVKVPDSTTTRTFSTTYATNTQSSLEELSLVCKSDNNLKVHLAGSLLHIDMRSSKYMPVQIKQESNANTNLTENLTLTGGTHKIAGLNITIQNGTQVLLSSMVSAYSPTQTHDVNFVMNSTNSETNKIRTITRDDYANIFMYDLANVTIGNTYEIALYAIVATGKSVEIKDESLVAFETSEIDFTTINTPPSVAILSPDEGDYISENYNINWSVTDSQSDTTLKNITLGSNLLVSNYNTINNYTFNTRYYVNGAYNLSVIAKENSTAELYTASNTIQININNTFLQTAYTSPTTAEGNVEDEKIKINISINDVSLVANVTFYLYDFDLNLLQSQTLVPTQNYSFYTFSALTNGNYKYKTITTTLAGETNETAIRLTTLTPSTGSGGGGGGSYVPPTEEPETNQTNITLPPLTSIGVFDIFNKNVSAIDYFREPVGGLGSDLRNNENLNFGIIYVLVFILMLLAVSPFLYNKFQEDNLNVASITLTLVTTTIVSIFISIVIIIITRGLT